MSTGNTGRAIIGKRYQLEKEIGRGGMGIVYLATDRHLNRLVAIKVLPPQISADTQTFSRFKNEVYGISRLEHPSIIKVYDAGVQGSYYYVMQYVDGPNLYNETLKRKQFTLKDALPILRQIASALDYAHNKGFIHRDVKPENILLDSHFNAYLVDFGIVLSSYMPKRFTQGFIGTPEYASPEHCKNEPLTGASDQYSFAIIAYEMLAGRAPFERGEDGNPVPVIVSQLNDPPPDPRQFNPEIPEHVAKALLRAISKKPEDRFASCQEFVDILSAVTIQPESEFVTKAKENSLQNEMATQTRPLEDKNATHELSQESEVTRPLKQEDEESGHSAKSADTNVDDDKPKKNDTNDDTSAPKSEKKIGGRLSESSFKPIPPPPSQPPMQSALKENKTREFYKPQPTAAQPIAVAVVEKPKSNSSGALVAILLVLILVLGGGGYYLYSSGKLAGITGQQTNSVAKAESFMAMGQFPEAIDEYTKILKNTPNDPKAMLGLAQAEAKQGNFEDAALNLDKLVESAPQFVDQNKDQVVELYNTCAEEFANADDAESAANCYKKLISMQPGEQDPIDKLITLSAKTGDKKSNVALYEELVKDNPTNIAIVDKLATEYLNSGNGTKAIELYKKAIENSDKKAPLYNKLGEIQMAMGDNKAAETSFTQAGDSDGNAHLAELYAKTGDEDKGFNLLKKMLSEDKDGTAKQKFSDIGYKLAVAALDKKNNAKAKQYISEIKNVNASFIEDKANELIKKGNSQFGAKQFKQAMTTYQKAAIFDESATVVTKIFETNYKLKNFAEVKNSYSKVLSLNKGDADATNKVKTIYNAVVAATTVKVAPTTPSQPTYTPPRQTYTPAYTPQRSYTPAYTPPPRQTSKPAAKQAPAAPRPAVHKPIPQRHTIQIPRIPSSEVDKGSVINIPKASDE